MKFSGEVTVQLAGLFKIISETIPGWLCNGGALLARPSTSKVGTELIKEKIGCGLMEQK